jgi:hypothetical protein
MKRPNVENGKEKIIAGALKLPAKLGWIKFKMITNQIAY